MRRPGKVWARAALAFALCLAAGCTDFKAMNATMNSMIGQDLKVAIDRLGFPHAEERIAGKRVLTWETQRSGSYRVPHTRYDTYYSRGRVYRIPRTTYTTHNFNDRCKVRVIVDEADTISRWDMDGNDGGCAVFARRLKGEE